MQYQLNKPGVLRESFEGEDVIINLDTGVYFLLDSVGSTVFALLETGLMRADILTCCANHYDGVSEAQVSEIDSLIEELVAEGIVVPTSGEGEINRTAIDTENIFSKREKVYVSPVLHRFTDMQELLLLDPVHEVDERGWPHASKDLDKHDS